ncbi:unnamed protein product, partial [Rotaria sp. Silwood1]
MTVYNIFKFTSLRLHSYSHRLPPTKETIFRGDKLDISRQYIVSERYFWWSLSSCTDSMDLLQSKQFCGQEEQRTIYFIKCNSGRCIKRHSFYSSEQEILLMPSFYFEVQSNNDLGNGLHLIEKESPKIMLPVPMNPGIFIEAICRNNACSLCNRQIRISFGFCCLDVLVDLDENN